MKKKITQRKFAELIGIKKCHMNRLVCGRGNASKELAERIANRLKCKPEIWIFGTADQRQDMFKRYQDRTK